EEGDGLPVGLAGVLGGDGQGGLTDGQAAIVVGDGVVIETGTHSRGGDDGVAADAGGDRAAGAGQADAGDGVGIEQAGAGEGAGPQVLELAVGLAGVLGGDGQGRLADRQAAIVVGDGVVVETGTHSRGGDDGVAADAGGDRAASAGQGDAGDGVGVEQAGAGEGAGPQVLELAVGLAGVLGGDGQGRLADRQAAIVVGDGVVVETGTHSRGGDDGVAADAGGDRAASAGQGDAGDGISVDQTV